MDNDKSKFLDVMGRPLTQSLFLEYGYNTDTAIYSLKEYDFTYRGVLYPSLKRIYLEEEDVVEYEFASKYFFSWDQWQRITANKAFSEEIDEWRYELELKLRSKGVRNILVTANSDKGFQAARWLAEKGWDRKGVGRPTKDHTAEEKAFEKHIAEEFKNDIARIHG